MNTLETGLGNFIILPPTVEDMLCVAHMMKTLAKKQCQAPLKHVLDTCANFPPQFLELAIKQAIALGSGGGAGDPSPALQEEQYTTEEGLAQRLHYHVALLKREFTLEQAREVIAKDGLWTTVARLEEALSPRADAKKNEPSTGTSTS